MPENYKAKIVEDKPVADTQALTDDEQPQGVEEIAEEAGINIEPEKPVETTQELERRDRDRWQLDPESKDNPQ